jgi:hypothetical protein
MIVGHLRTKNSTNLVLLHDLLEAGNELNRVGRKGILKKFSRDTHSVDAEQVANFVASGPHRERNGIAPRQHRKR